MIKAPMSVLVTGASGMLGSALMEALGTDPRFRPVGAYRRMPQPLSIGEPRLVGDIDGATEWRAVLTGCEAVVHCAARAHVLRETSQDSTQAFNRVNVEGTLALARQAIETGIRHFIFISSSGVHGSQNSEPASEMQVLAPTEPYAISKLRAEQSLRHLAAASPMTVTVVRPPLVYGPLVRGNMKRLTSLVLSGLPLPFGTVRNTRSFVGVTNLCDAIINCLDDERAAGRTYLVTDQADMSTPQLITAIADAAGRSALLMPIPIPALKLAAALAGRADLLERLVGSLQFDSSAISAELGWSPPMPPQHDISRMVRWFRGAGGEI